MSYHSHEVQIGTRMFKLEFEYENGEVEDLNYEIIENDDDIDFLEVDEHAILTKAESLAKGEQIEVEFGEE